MATAGGRAVVLLTLTLLLLSSGIAALTSAQIVPTVSVDDIDPNECKKIDVGADTPGTTVFTTAVHVNKPPLGEMVVTITASVAGQPDWVVIASPSEITVSEQAADETISISVEIPPGTSSEQEGSLTVTAVGTYGPASDTDSKSVLCNLARTISFTASAAAESGDREKGFSGKVFINNTGNGQDAFRLSVPDRARYQKDGLKIPGVVATSDPIGSGGQGTISFTLKVEKDAPAGKVSITFDVLSINAPEEAPVRKQVVLEWELEPATALEQLEAIIPIQTLIQLSIVSVVLIVLVVGVVKLRRRSKRKKDEMLRKRAARAAARHDGDDESASSAPSKSSKGSSTAKGRRRGDK